MIIFAYLQFHRSLPASIRDGSNTVLQAKQMNSIEFKLLSGIFTSMDWQVEWVSEIKEGRQALPAKEEDGREVGQTRVKMK
jgi:hypothetical protein